MTKFKGENNWYLRMVEKKKKKLYFFEEIESKDILSGAELM